MKLRKTPIDKEIAKKLRAELYTAIDRGEVSLQDAVKRMRKISRLSQPEFAAHLGVGAKVVKEIERGVGNPTVASLNRIGRFFGLEVAFVRSEKLRVINQAKNIVEQDVRSFVEPLTDLERLVKGGDTELNVVKEAQKIIDSVAQIQRQLQPPPAVTQWLADIEAANKLLNPLDDPSRRILENLKKN